MFGRARNRRRKAPRRQPDWLARPRLPQLPWSRIMPWLTGAAALSAAVLLLAWVADQPIRTVSIAGRFERVSPMDVQRAVRESTAGKGLISVNLAAVRDAVRAVPWVDTVGVERNFPHGLTVVIGEQRAAARWSGGGLVNVRGELFASDPRHIPPELPLLSGPDGTQAQVVSRYLAMRGRLQEVGMRLLAVRLTARGAWEFDLDNGVTVRLGRQDLDGRFDTFMATAVKIVSQRATDISYVDMRYANGFAIGWRTGADGGAGSGVHARSPEGEARNV